MWLVHIMYTICISLFIAPLCRSVCVKVRGTRLLEMSFNFDGTIALTEKCNNEESGKCIARREYLFTFTGAYVLQRLFNNVVVFKKVRAVNCLR